MKRRAIRATLAAVVLSAVCAASALAGVPTAAQRLCITRLNEAGAGVADAGGKNVVRCIRNAGRARLRKGETCTQCLAADHHGGLARARAATAKVAARACTVAPEFGPTGADAVNDAFARLLRLDAVFGASVDAAIIPARHDRAGAACQTMVARGLTTIATARVREFNACKAAGLKAGTITSAADFRPCFDVDPRGRVAKAIARAEARADRRCRRTAIATAFPGECAGQPLADLFQCLARRVACDVCGALESADGMDGVCHRIVDGVAVGSCDQRPAMTQSVARQWDEELLSAIRRDNPRPPVHARNLFHLSIAMYDAWAAYDATAKPYLTPEHATSTDVERDRATAIGFAAYRVLSERYSAALALGADASQASFDARLAALGYDQDFVSTDGSSPAALGNRIAAAVIAFGQSDGANEAANYADPTYTAVNDPLIVKILDLDFTTVHDVNRWQPLALDQMIGQNGVPLPGKIQKFVGSQWGNVTPFALTHVTPGDLYLDPGPQPHLGDAAFTDQVKEVIEKDSRLTPDDPTMMDVSPASYGNNPLGTNDGHGYTANPVTGQSYTPQMVKRGDFGRVIAEFWADGPTSETPPGHWNVLANTVADTPGFEKRFAGTGPLLNALEWDVKTYFALNAAVHDAAIACWGAKRVYDGVRPITMIRYMGKKGQSSDMLRPAYDPSGLPLEDGVIEIITLATTAPGQRHEALAGHEGEIAVLAWPGGPVDPTTQHSGVQWVLARGWIPYQRSTFVTPAFPGYFSGHSTFSRSAAEVLAAITGSPYFPGGLGEFLAPQDAFLKFELGPSTDVRLQWVTYYDAADQAGQSRLWGGIHVAVDDFTGRTRGHLIGMAAFDKAKTYFTGQVAP